MFTVFLLPSGDIHLTWDYADVRIASREKLLIIDHSSKGAMIELFVNVGVHNKLQYK